jgi:hypothetical protein
MNKKFLLALEIIWITTGTLAILTGIRYAVKTGGNKTFVFAALALISFLFAWLRHRERKKS